MSRPSEQGLPSQMSRPRQWPGRISKIIFYIYALFLLGEFVAIGAFGSDQAFGTLVIYGICLLPAGGLAKLVHVATSGLSSLTGAVLVFTCLAGGVLIFDALHLAPPDALNIVVVAMVALVQFAALVVLGLIWGIGRWRHRHDDSLGEKGR